MAATVKLRCLTGDPLTASADQTALYLISADTTASGYTSYPINNGENSYTKTCCLCVTGITTGVVSNWKAWTDSGASTNVAVVCKTQQGTGGADPAVGNVVNSRTAITGTDFYTYTAGNKAQWDSSSYSTTNSYTKAMVLQLQATMDAAAGDVAFNLYYSYDET